MTRQVTRFLITTAVTFTPPIPPQFAEVRNLTAKAYNFHCSTVGHCCDVSVGNIFQTFWFCFQKFNMRYQPLKNLTAFAAHTTTATTRTLGYTSFRSLFRLQKNIPANTKQLLLSFEWKCHLRRPLLMTLLFPPQPRVHSLHNLQRVSWQT